MAGSHLTGPIVSEQGFKLGTKSTNTTVISSAGAITATTSITAGTFVSGSLIATKTTAVYSSTHADANIPSGSYSLALSSTIAGSGTLFAMGTTGSFILAFATAT